MNHPYYETFHDIGNSGIHLAFYTTPGGYRPLHWHEELEILYPLNGLSDITVEGTKFSLPKNRLWPSSPWRCTAPSAMTRPPCSFVST